MKENRARFVILGLLSHQPMSGYELKKYSTEWISYFWDIGYGQIYPALKEMSGAGLVEITAAKGKRAESKTYSLTPAGKAELLKWLKSPKKNEVYRSELLLKMFFSALIEPGFSVEKMKALKTESEKHGKILHGAVLDLEKNISVSPDHPYYMFTAMFGERYYKMCGEWADEVLRILGRIKRSAKRRNQREG
jgi:DNA-binding PadR family transcriptional regulator